MIGPLATALEEAQTAIDLTGGDPDVGTEFLGYSPLVRCTINRSMVHTLMGRLEDARTDAEWGLAAARRVAELENVVIGLYATNLWAFHAGEADGALARARETLEAAELTTRYLLTYAWEGMGMACLLAEQFDDCGRGARARRRRRCRRRRRLPGGERPRVAVRCARGGRRCAARRSTLPPKRSTSPAVGGPACSRVTR